MRHATGCLRAFHRIDTTARGLVLDEAQAERTSTILVTRELGDGCLGVFDGIEANNTSAAGATIGFVLDFSLLDLANGGEELNKILVAGRPR